MLQTAIVRGRIVCHTLGLPAPQSGRPHCVAAVLCLLLLPLSFRAVLRRLDLAILRVMRTRGHWPPLERSVSSFSRLGEHSALWLGVSVAGSIVDRRRRRTYARLAGTVAVVEVVNALTKISLARARPVLDGLPPLMATKSNRSLPSAHAATSFAAARVLSRTLAPAPVYAVAAAMALSRPYLGVHYPSDIVAGFALGTLTADLLGARRERSGREKTAGHPGGGDARDAGSRTDASVAEQL
jgi:membrane-associated phospholipid phosphatase